MINPFNDLPSYISDSPRFSRFLELVNAYLISGAVNVEKLKQAFLNSYSNRFVIQALANQSGAIVELPFLDDNKTEPDWDTYFYQLSLADRAVAFRASFDGTAYSFNYSDKLGDVAVVQALDFAVLKKDGSGIKSQNMSVVYSVLSMDERFTFDIAQRNLIPNITGVGSGLYFLLFGQSIFGYDLDEEKRRQVKLVDGEFKEVDLENQTYVVSGAVVVSGGSGYAVGDELDVLDSDGVATGVKLVVTSNSPVVVSVSNMSNTYSTDVSSGGATLSTSGGSGSGLTVKLSITSNKGYYIRGFDLGNFIASGGSNNA